MGRRKTRNRAADPERSTLRAVGRALSLTASIAVFGGLGLALLFGTGRLEQRVERRLAARGPRVVFEWPPLAPDSPGATWLPADFQAHLRDVATLALRDGHRALDREPLERLGRALDRTGWFVGGPRLRREPGGTIRVSGTWRIPAAVVRHGNLDHLVAAGGELLPGLYTAGLSGYRVIEGARQPPPRENGEFAYGQPWPGDEVQAGVRLLSLLSTKPWWPQVRAVDVGDYKRRRRLVIVTDRGARIVWGAAPGEPIPGEQSDQVKLQRLDMLAERHGRIDAGKAAIEIFGPITLVDDSATGGS